MYTALRETDSYVRAITTGVFGDTGSLFRGYRHRPVLGAMTPPLPRYGPKQTSCVDVFQPF